MTVTKILIEIDRSLKLETVIQALKTGRVIGKDSAGTIYYNAALYKHPLDGFSQNQVEPYFPFQCPDDVQFTVEFKEPPTVDLKIQLFVIGLNGQWIKPL